MAQKKQRAFFICPRWNQIADPQSSARVNEKTLAAIRAGRPLARSTLRKALLAARRASGSLVDVDSFIVDQRVT